MKQISDFADVKHISTKQISMSMSDFTQNMCDVILSNRLECLMFFAAVLGYLILFCARLPTRRACQKNEGEVQASTDEEQSPSVEPPGSLKAASKERDDGGVLCCLDAPTQFEQAPTIPLHEIVKSMRVNKKDAQSIAKELHTFFLSHPDVCKISIVNDFLEHLGKQLDSELMDLILDMLPSMGLNRDQRNYEIFLKMHVAARDYPEIQDLITDMDANSVPLSARAVFFVMKGALQAQDFDQSFKYFKELKVAWAGQSTSEPLVPQSIMVMLVDLAWEEQHFGQLIVELRGMPLPENTIDTMLAKCVESYDSDTARSVESLARGQRTTLPDSTYNLLIKAMTHRPLRARGIIEEVLAREESRFAPDLALSVIDFSNGVSDVTIVDRLFERMKPKPVNVLGAFVWFYIGVEQFEKACDVYELDLQPICSNSDGSTSLDASLQESIVDAAVVCGRSQLAERLVAEARAGATGQIAIACRITLHLKQLIEAIIAMLARWNAVVSYWVVLVF